FYDDGFLFIHGGKRINPRAVDTRIRKYCDHINIRQKGLHTIRKTYISSLLDGGININEIRKQVGHEDERTTLKNYCFNRKTSIENESDMEKALAV
ncbi:tyrosine-type recombinase/integrase, partial [Lacrimispora sp.]|uniref:tyrosine-type recombinase/integrase n=1 Tax=Lacrimispora sp. TaxID=2719234 RepID=UPI0028ADC2AD